MSEETTIQEGYVPTNDTTEKKSIQYDDGRHLSPDLKTEVQEKDANFSESLNDAEKQYDINESEPPDQGLRAWLVVLGVSLTFDEMISSQFDMPFRHLAETLQHSDT